MPDTSPQNTPQPRNGCAVWLGLLLVSLGSLFLAQNILGFSLLRFWSRAFDIASVYWPVILIIWGLYKLYQRHAYPGLARVGVSEVFLLAMVLLAGMAVGAGRRAMVNLSTDLSWNEALGLLGPKVVGPGHRFTESEVFELPGGTRLAIQAHRARVTITGWDEPRVEVQSTKRTHHASAVEAERLSDQVGLDFEIEGDAARLSLGRGRSADKVETSLTLRVPRTAGLSVVNRRGSIQVRNMTANIHLESSHAPIRVSDVEGEITAVTSYSPIHIVRAKGNASATNRRGNITVRELTGALDARSRSGTVSVDGVSGDTTLEGDHATLRARSVGGNLTVTGDYTRILAVEVSGDVSVSTTRRAILVQDVAGTVKVVTRNAPVQFRDVEKDVDVVNRLRPVRVSRVGGSLSLRTKNSPIRAAEVRGAVHIEASHHPVQVIDFEGPLEVTAEHASVEARSRSLGGKLTVVTSYGDIDVMLPSDASFDLSARTKDGDLTSDFPDGGWNASEDQDGTSWHARRLGAQQNVQLTTRYGDITVKERREK